MADTILGQDSRILAIRWAEDAFKRAREDYERYEDYYNGDHELQFATDRWKTAFGTVFEQFADNWCQVVVDAPAQRLEITGWECDTDKDAAKTAEAIWDDNELQVEADDLHTQTFVKGDAYLMCWPEPMTPQEYATYTEAQLDLPVQVFYHDALDMNVVYDQTNRRVVARAAKRWIDLNGEVHLRLYYPDRTEFYFVPPNTNELLMQGVVTPDQVMPENWIQERSPEPNPYGEVPVFHFKNKAPGSTHGMSEIKIVIPIQEAINKVLMDMMVASEFGGFKQKWAVSSAHPPEGWRTGNDRVWSSTDPQAKFGQFDESDLQQFTRVIEMLVGHVAKVTQTPMHYLRVSGDMPSGEALKTAESALVHKVKDRQRRWSMPWAKAMTFAVQIRSGSRPSSLVTPIWRDAETRHDLEQAQTAQLKSILGIPLYQLWAEHFDYTQEQIAAFEEDNMAVAAAVLAQTLAQSGQLPPGQSQIDPAVTLQFLQQAKQLRTGEKERDTEGRVRADISQVLALLPKGVTSGTTAGEATTKPQPNTSPPASPTRRSRGFRD